MFVVTSSNNESFIFLLKESLMENFIFLYWVWNPVGIYLLKVNNRNTRTRCEICSGVFIVNFEHISHLVLVFLLLALNMQMPTGKCTLYKNN